MITRASTSALKLALCAMLATLAFAQEQPATRPGHGLTVDALDNMSSLPGNLSALPTGPPVAADNPQTPEKVALGRALFFERQLSRGLVMRCATCHDPAKGFSDGMPRAMGSSGHLLPRRSPGLLNAAYNSLQFWDGRARTLEEQAEMPMLSPTEMAMPSREMAVRRLLQSPGYRDLFFRAFAAPISFQRIVQALAAFERTLITPGSAFDRYSLGDKKALTPEQKRGLLLFIGKASCSQCHNGPNFTDNKFHNLGHFPGEEGDLDPGRFAITRNPADRSAFKTPGLRNNLRGPYMHNGALSSLPEVIAFYNRGGGTGRKSDLIRPLELSPPEHADLLSFLESLTGTEPRVEEPIDAPDAGAQR